MNTGTADFGGLGSSNYIDLGTPPPNLHRYGDPHPHIYDIDVGTPTYIMFAVAMAMHV